MSRLSRAAGRCLMELVAPELRDWAEAVWAEAGEVPPGLARLAWRAGGVRLIAREAMLARRAARALVFAAAAVWVARAAWPGPAGNPATAVNRLNVVTVVAVLAGLPLLARWRFGPAAPGRMARALRSGAYAAVLILTVAKASVEQLRDDPAAVPHLKPDDSVPVLTGMIYTWLIQSLFLLAVAGYVAAILALTARRPRVAPATLAAGPARASGSAPSCKRWLRPGFPARGYTASQPAWSCCSASSWWSVRRWWPAGLPPGGTANPVGRSGPLRPG
jgi:hypothetical protein